MMVYETVDWVVFEDDNDTEGTVMPVHFMEIESAVLSTKYVIARNTDYRALLSKIFLGNYSFSGDNFAFYYCDNEYICAEA